MSAKAFKAGFVNILGRPNVGKSTLMNALLGERLSIVTAKAQTTRHRIFGILTEQDYQIVFSDTPGFLEPKYALHEAMMQYVKTCLEDADIILLMADVRQAPFDDVWLEQVKQADAHILIVLNKADLSTQQEVEQQVEAWQQSIPQHKGILVISAKEGFHLPELKQHIISLLPEHPAYYPLDQLTEQTERFFAAEIIREKLLLLYEDEIPYCCEVVIDSFKEKEDILVIQSLIFVERLSQKAIVIGKNGTMLKKLGVAARTALEEFFGRKVYLETYIKVDEHWRQKKQKLQRFGYFAD
jgi:GTP-binding protein Era